MISYGAAALLVIAGIFIYGKPPEVQITIMAYMLAGAAGWVGAEAVYHWIYCRIYYPWMIKRMHGQIQRLLKQKWDGMSHAERRHHTRLLKLAHALFNNETANMDQTMKLLADLKRKK